MCMCRSSCVFVCVVRRRAACSHNWWVVKITSCTVRSTARARSLTPYVRHRPRSVIHCCRRRALAVTLDAPTLWCSFYDAPSVWGIIRYRDPSACLSHGAAALGFRHTGCLQRPVWARGHCRISPPRFLVECCKRQLNQGSFVLLLFTFSDLYWVCIFLYCFVFCLSVGECLFWYRPTRVVPDQRPLVHDQKYLVLVLMYWLLHAKLLRKMCRLKHTRCESVCRCSRKTDNDRNRPIFYHYFHITWCTSLKTDTNLI